MYTSRPSEEPGTRKHLLPLLPFGPDGVGSATAARLMRRMGIEGSIPGTQGLARTILMSASNFVHERTYAANASIISGVRHLATLDGRTCLRCGPLDGKEYALDEERPTLPLHWRCRCVYVPVVKTWRDRGIDADEFQGGQRPAVKHEGRTVHHRDGSTSTAFTVDSAGRVPAGTTYSAWLRGQLETDPAFVESVLGSARYDLFRQGKLDLRAMSTRGHVKTLVELEY